MTFSEAIATQAPALRLWVLWLTIVMLAAPAVMLAFRASRRDGLIVLATSLAVMVAMQGLHTAVGFVRLLGLAHVVFWAPLAVWLALRWRRASWPLPARIAVGVFLASVAVSLAFDIRDVALYLAGDRDSLVPG